MIDNAELLYFNRCHRSRVCIHCVDLKGCRRRPRLVVVKVEPAEDRLKRRPHVKKGSTEETQADPKPSNGKAQRKKTAPVSPEFGGEAFPIAQPQPHKGPAAFIPVPKSRSSPSTPPPPHKPKRPMSTLSRQPANNPLPSRRSQQTKTMLHTQRGGVSLPLNECAMPTRRSRVDKQKNGWRKVRKSGFWTDGIPPSNST